MVFCFCSLHRKVALDQCNYPYRVWLGWAGAVCPFYGCVVGAFAYCVLHARASGAIGFCFWRKSAGGVKVLCFKMFLVKRCLDLFGVKCFWCRRLLLLVYSLSSVKGLCYKELLAKNLSL